MQEIHPAKALWESMDKQFTTYPEGMCKVPEAIPGKSFFPGGYGLYTPTVNDDLPIMPFGGIMVVGQDFDKLAGYKRTWNAKMESDNSPTWRNLLAFLKETRIDPTDCFFTNALMGLRTTEKATGKSPGLNNNDFILQCARFLEEQINLQKPKLILALGAYAPLVIAETSQQLEEWKNFKRFKEFDNSGALKKGISFKNISNYKTNIAVLIHPSYRALHVKNRTYKNSSGQIFTSHEAELEMIKDALKN